MRLHKAVLLNFLPIVDQHFMFSVHRSATVSEDGKDRFYYCTLPVGTDLNERRHYWTSFEPLLGFEQTEIPQDHNNRLTIRFLDWLLKTHCANVLPSDSYVVQQGILSNRTWFITRSSKEGKETIWLEPYYLNELHQFGYLIDFEFRKDPDIPYSRQVQRLTLSLDEKFRANRNYYLDKFDRITGARRNILSKVFPIPYAHRTLAINDELCRVPVERLASKTYVFANSSESNSQFKGLLSHSVLEKPATAPRFLFLYTHENHPLARDLYRALSGSSYSHLFRGVKDVFGVPFNSDRVNGETLENYSNTAYEKALANVRNHGESTLLPVLIVPSRKRQDSQDIYVRAKHFFISRGLPIQVVTADLISDREAFKWSVANIALQMFAKCGGKPWKVKATDDSCLIIGIGQAHRVDDSGMITKYLAYSVLLSSAGLYRDLRVLSQADDKKTYLSTLGSALRSVLSEERASCRRIVIHTPYKLSKEEIGIVRDRVREAATTSGQQCEFLVLKVNTLNKFFGFSEGENSLVPYESTFIKLSRNEYLVWFEGLQYHNPVVSKRFGGPVHIEFYYSTVEDLSPDAKRQYLQDTLNLSGANWRGFNAKTMPVSVYYCQLVARFIREFQVRDLPDVDINNLQPWFL